MTLVRPPLRPLLCALLLNLPGTAGAQTPQALLETFTQQARNEDRAYTGPSAARGGAWFRQQHGGDWSCASCHTAKPHNPGRHAATGKPIAALAPAANPRRLSDPAKVDKWFRRNCRDVLARECTAAEKSDVVAFLLTAP